MAEVKKRIPKRRFKEFQNAEAWEQRDFGKVFNHLQNNSFSRAQLSYENGEVMNIHYGDVLIEFGECLDISQNVLPRIINNDFVDKYRTSYIENGDVIIADAAEDETVGKCCEIKGLKGEKVLSGLHTIPCRPIIRFATGYLGYYMNSGAYHDQLLPLMQGTKVSSISKTALTNTNISYPRSIEEQKKIGTCFIELDNLISLHQRKLDKIKSMKKAYLSEMFPAEGERKPNRRFKGFTDEWELCEFKDIFKLSQGLQIEISKRYRESGTNRYFYITNEFLKEGSNEQYYIVSPPQSVICIKEDILMTRTGNTGIVVTNVEGCFHNNFFKIKYNSNLFNQHFICQFLSTEVMQKRILNSAGSSTIPDLSHKSFYKLNGFFPALEEQKKISCFLNELDNLITLHQQKLDKLKNLKKSYLNEMFV